MKLVIIIPALNEAKTVGLVINAIPRNIEGIDSVEIALIDDGSSDETANVALESGADFVVRHNRNCGVGAAIKTGITQAIIMNADVICMVDADGQFDVAEIESLIQPILANKADLVIGSRFQRISKAYGISIIKRIGNKIVATVVSLLIATRITDAECGFRALNRQAADELELLGRFTFTHDMLLDLAVKHFRIVEVPVTVRYFKGRKSRAIGNFVVYGIGVLGIIIAKTILSIKRRILPYDNARSRKLYTQQNHFEAIIEG